MALNGFFTRTIERCFSGIHRFSGVLDCGVGTNAAAFPAHSILFLAAEIPVGLANDL
jgi:hypothetical protein